MERSVLDVVYPVLERVLKARARCLRPDCDDEQASAELFRTRELLVPLLDRVMHARPGGVGELMRRVLIYWVDEVFTVEPTLRPHWVSNTMELLLLNSRDRAEKFWDVVAERHRSPDLAQLCRLCVQLGFVGQLDPARQEEVILWLRPPPPPTTLVAEPEPQPIPPCPPLRGAAWLQAVVWLTWLFMAAWLGTAVYYLAYHAQQ
jgi:hypothetical protein